MIKRTSLITLVSLFSSCAPIVTQIPTKRPSNPIVQPIPTSDVISNYKIESEKSDLDDIINEKELSSETEFLKDINNTKVKFWIDYFGNKEKDRFERFMANGQKYKEIIEEIFEDYGLPKELFYVGLIESGYYLQAKSHANAVGPWQFIKSTARRYGLNVNSSVDERKSIYKSTKAAALFFQDLYNIFGSWELALSAYNAGEYGIIRRIRKAKTRDYYELSANKKLPKETIHYVPKVLAVMELASNPKKYNLKIVKGPSNHTNTKFIKLFKSLSLNEIAKKSNTSTLILKKLNPDLLNTTTPYLKRGYDLRVPNADYSFVEKLNPTTLKKVVAKDTYKIKDGDSLIGISKKLNVSLNAILAKNNLSRNSIIKTGQILKISSKSETPNFIYYRVRKGDNLYLLARKNHTSISEIMKLNNLRRKTIYAGQKIKFPYIEKTFYTVRPGDYLGKIATKFGLTINKIKSLNAMRRSQIFPGQRLIVKVD